MSELVHIAGPELQVGSQLRQRCAWCGAVLLDYDLAAMSRALEPGEDPDAPWRPSTWEVGAHIAVEGTFPRASWVVEPEEHDDGSLRIPERSCMALDPAATT